MINIGLKEGNYIIKSYSRGFKVYKDLHKIDKEGNPILNFLGYTTSLEHSLNLIQRNREIEHVATKDMTLSEAIKEFREIHEELKGIIPEFTKEEFCWKLENEDKPNGES